jgi:hypothetical protein
MEETMENFYNFLKSGTLWWTVGHACVGRMKAPAPPYSCFTVSRDAEGMEATRRRVACPHSGIAVTESDYQRSGACRS